MQAINFTYTNNDDLSEVLTPLQDESNILIQIYFGIENDMESARQSARELISFCTKNLPQAHILLASAAISITNGSSHIQKTTISISIFEKTTIKSQNFINDEPSKIAANIATNLISQKTKLLFMYIEGLTFKSAAILEELYKLAPHVIIAGGGASENLTRQTTFIGSKDGIDDNNLVVCASLDSDDLQVTEYRSFGWQQIGINMTITDSNEKGEVFTINNIPAQELYKRYFGNAVGINLIGNSIMFPITFIDNGLLVGYPFAELLENGAVRFPTPIKKGTNVRFGVGLMDSILENSRKIKEEIIAQNAEAVFIFACVTRYYYLQGNKMDFCLDNYENCAPSAGFFSYGEFFHNESKNYYLSTSNVVLGLSENPSIKPEPQIKIEQEKEPELGKPNIKLGLNSEVILQSLVNLATATNNDYNEIIAVFGQYKSILEENSILLYLDMNGHIIGANDNFYDISSLKKGDIIGKPIASLIKSSDQAAQINEHLEKHGKWSGVLEVRTAGNKEFYMRTVAKKIFNYEIVPTMILISMDDITEYELKNKNLEQSINALSEISSEKNELVEQYKELLDANAGMVKLKDDIILDVNETYKEVMGYERRDMIGRNINEFIIPDARFPKNPDELLNDLSINGSLRAIIPVRKQDGGTMYLQAYATVTSKVDGISLAIMHDVTDIFAAQKELTDIQKEVIYAMGAISEGHSRETGNHIRRVAEYSYLLAKLYGLDEKSADLIKTASPMHDLGKLAIPDAILNKPGKLTPEEFEVIKTHAQKGYDMLCFSPRPILKTAAIIALTHHEWWNGEGYPNKLKGEDIPLVGRITAVADVFDALSNDRCYKKAWPLDEVLEHMTKNKDIQFESKIVDLLLENIEQFSTIQKQFEDKFENLGQ